MSERAERGVAPLLLPIPNRASNRPSPSPLMVGWPFSRRAGGGAPGPEAGASAAAEAPPAATAAAAATEAAATAAAPPPPPPSVDPRAYSRQRGGLYDRYFSWLMGRMSAHEIKLAPLKRRLFERMVDELRPAAGGGANTNSSPLRILEVGAGRGPNFQQVADVCASRGLPRPHLTCIEPNTAMHEACRAAATAAGFDGAALDLRALYAEQLSPELFSSSSSAAGGDGTPPLFDAAVVTLVLCSVPDVPSALAAIRRVVKPGGRLLLLEHVAADPQRCASKAKMQRLLDPAWHYIGDGCSLTRNTRGALRAAGLMAAGAGDNEGRLQDVGEDEGGGGMGGLLPLVAGVLEM